MQEITDAAPNLIIQSLIEETLSELIPVTTTPYNEIFLAARYSLLGGGKRLRPLLAIVTAEMFQVPAKKAVIPACALEMIHTYSLIHDDLPCMDDDDFRRGKPSLHKAFNEGVALLAGDYLLTYAFDVLTNAEDLSDNQKLELISVLAKSGGGNGMIAGQIMDVSFSEQMNLELLQETHLKKTGMLIAAALQFGAIIGNASSESREILEQFGLKIGLAFQIMDDVLDVTASMEKHGRQQPSDEINGKTTYVSLLGVDGSKKLAEAITNEALELLCQLPCNSSNLESLAKSLINRTM